MDTYHLILLSAGAAFVAIFLLCAGAIRLAQDRSQRRKMVEKITTHTHYGPSGGTPGDHPAHTSKKGLQFSFLQRMGKKISPEGSDQYSLTRKRFLKAGLRWEGAPSVFWGIKILLPFIMVGLFIVLQMKLTGPLPPHMAILVFILLAAGGFYAPDFWLQYKTMTRREEFFRGLPDALDLMVVCVEAGMGLDATINRVGDEMALSNKVISDEFKLINLELRAGKRREDALRNLSQRTDLEDVRALVTMLIQTEKFGTSIAKSLRVFADAFRSKRFQKAEEIAAKMPIKLIFPLILFIFPSIFIVTVGPGAIRIYQNILMQ
jgi:tight adherence protein C